MMRKTYGSCSIQHPRKQPLARRFTAQLIATSSRRGDEVVVLILLAVPPFAGFPPVVDYLRDLEQCLRVCASEIAAKLSASGSRAVSYIELELDTSSPTGAASGATVKRHYFRRPADSLQQLRRAVILAAEGRISGPVSAICVRASGLVAPATVQLSIFGPAAEAESGRRELERAVESIREKFGAKSVVTANTLVRSRRDRMLAEALL